MKLIGKWLLLLWVVPGLVMAGPASETKDQLPEAALQNPVLRGHFRQMALEARARVLPDGRRVYRPDYFLKDRVDGMVRGFLTELIRRRDKIGESVEVCRLARERILRQPSNREAYLVLAASLNQLAKRAGKLRSLLKPVLSDLNAKSHNQPSVEGSSASTGFESEMEFLIVEAARARDLINGFFFQPSHTVDVRTLEDGNMLVRLDRVTRMAEELALRVGPGQISGPPDQRQAQP